MWLLHRGTISFDNPPVAITLISLLPILELRGGLLAASLLGLDPLPSYIITMVGNLLPIPFILWFITMVSVARGISAATGHMLCSS